MDLFAAAKTGDTAQVTAILVDDPRSARHFNDRNRTALHYATREGHADVVQILLEAGADPNSVVYPNKEVTLPRTLASERGHTDVVAILDAWTARSTPETASSIGGEICAAATAGNIERIRELCKEPDALRATDFRGNTALHLAAEQGHRQLVLVLLDLGADPEALNTSAQKPIHLALSKNPYGTSKADLATAGLLLGHGAQCDFWTACALGDLVKINELGTDDSDAIHQHHPSYPITIAAALGHLDAVKWLLANNADPDAPRLWDPDALNPHLEYGAPILFATRNQHRAVVRTLLEAGANPNTTLIATANAPSEAYQNGYDDIAADLFRYGGIPDASSHRYMCQYTWNRCPIHWIGNRDSSGP